MKVLHFADLHTRDKDLEEIKKCCEKVVNTAYTEKPDLIVNAGDSSDSQGIKLDSDSARFLFEFHAALSKVAPVAVVIGTPSHDGTAGLALKHSASGHNVIVSSRPEQLYLDSKGELHRLYEREAPRDVKTVISMLPTPTKQFFQTGAGIAQSDEEIGNAVGAILAGFGASASRCDCPHILVGHFQVGGACISEGQQLVGRDIEISKDQIALANADLVCLGHIHMPQKIGENIFYSGSLARLNWGEMESKGFFVHEVLEGLNSENDTAYPRGVRAG